MKDCGSKDVHEVALGADIGAVAEAHHYVKEVVNGDLPFASYIMLSGMVNAC